MSNFKGFLNEDKSDIDLYGIENDLFDEEFDDDEVGRLPRNRSRSISRMRRRARRHITSTANLTAKSEFEKRINMLPKDIKADLKAGRLQLVDGRLYSAKNIGGLSSAELMANADTKTVGLTNVNNRKLEANQYFLITGIRILAFVDDPSTPAQTVKNAPYAKAPAVILNGEFGLEIGSTKLLPDNLSASVFDVEANSKEQAGYYKLANPKFIVPQTEIVPELKLAAGAAANTYVRIELIGAMLEKK